MIPDSCIDYLIKRVGPQTFEVTKFDGNPMAVYLVEPQSGRCTCPAKVSCKHLRMINEWLNKGKENEWRKEKLPL